MFSAELISIIICDFQCQVQPKHWFRVVISPLSSNGDGELICTENSDFERCRSYSTYKLNISSECPQPIWIKMYLYLMAMHRVCFRLQLCFCLQRLPLLRQMGPESSLTGPLPLCICLKLYQMSCICLNLHSLHLLWSLKKIIKSLNILWFCNTVFGQCSKSSHTSCLHVACGVSLHTEDSLTPHKVHEAGSRFIAKMEEWLISFFSDISAFQNREHFTDTKLQESFHLLFQPFRKYNYMGRKLPHCKKVQIN